MSDTIQITLEYWGQLREAAGISTEQMTAPAGVTLAELLLQLAQRGGRLRTVLLNGQGKPRASNMILLDNRLIRDLGTERLVDRQTVMLVAPVGGG